MALYSSAIMAVLLWRPQHDGFLRYGLPSLAACMWIGLVIAAWKRQGGLRWVVLSIPLLIALPLLLPAKELDRDRLEERYLGSLRALEGATYVWGGESPRGIDCSGLPRYAMRLALADQAAKGNGAAARLWLKHWWYDTSAKAMGESYRDFTRPAGIVGNLRELNPSRLQKGDLAVTDDTRHVLIYMGGGEWIQAEPSVGRVFTASAGSELSVWLASDVSIHRWTVLAD